MKSTNNLLNSLTENESDLRQYLINKVGCIETAADIFQKMAEKILVGKVTTKILNHRRYLFRIANNEVIDHYRFEKSRLKYETDFSLSIENTEHRSAERITIANDGLRVLNESLEQLPPLTRKIFILYRIEGLKQALIAKQLGLNLSTVEKRLATAVKHCRSRIIESEIYGKSN
ncbi:MAG: hypothetical protein COA90_00625 [Gammaproteobacteria bacterium]|nr:MAG: hypothetical protein COA90_00625 [Gammaproteobacteria bacterium]